MAISRHITFCRVCTARCGIVVSVERNRIVDIKGDQSHPISKGFFCVKGQASQDFQNGEDRLVESLKRNRNGSFSTCDTQQALDEIAAQLTRIVEKNGPKSLAVYYGTGSKSGDVGVQVMKSWLRSMESPNLFSSSTLDQSAKWVTQGRLGVFTTGTRSINEIDVALISGNNPVISQLGLYILPPYAQGVALADAKKRGVKLIVIDPRRTETARQADIHLQPLPNEDPTIFAGMIREILRNGWEDKQFCQRYITSLEALRSAVEPFTPEYVAQRADIDVDQFLVATRMFALSKRRTAKSGTGPNMAIHSNLAEHLIAALNSICGVFRRAGDTIANRGLLTPRSNPQEGVIPPNRSWESDPKLPISGAGKIGGEFPTSRLPGEILSDHPERIRALIVFGGDPVQALGDGSAMAKAMEKLELVVTIDPRMTETARRSHYVIAPTSSYERYDTTHMLDAAMETTFAQVTTPFISPPPGVIADWEFFYGMAQRLDVPLSLTIGATFGGIPGVGPTMQLYPGPAPTQEDIIRFMLAKSRVAYEEFLANPSGVELDLPPLVVQPAAEDDGHRLNVCPPDVAKELADFLTRTSDLRFPFRLVTRRLLETMNGAFVNSGRARRRYPVNRAYMHPDDMKELDLVNGDSIEMESFNGTVQAPVWSDLTVRRRLVSMSHMWGRVNSKDDPDRQQGSPVGSLVSIDLDIETINFMPRQSGIPIKLRKLHRTAPKQPH